MVNQAIRRSRIKESTAPAEQALARFFGKFPCPD